MKMCFPNCGEPHSVLKVCMLLLIVSNTLCENLRCNDCDKGYFIKRNCSETSDGWLGTQCQPCSKCDGEGQRLFVNCSRYSNTLCDCGDGYVQTSNSSCQKALTTPPSTVVVTPKMKPRKICMMAAVPVFLAVFLLVLAVSVLIIARVSFKPGGKLLKNSIKPDII
ncbi:uncharacterized protein LOC143103637 isoform X1 [Alosa pseudoharengus]|uniref:uncharacterized protein LOC143103637 isoform X1 n=1 Tax=Alosa pseudoharengus TaxID=34774 RepID=UPI003F898C9F